MQVLPAEVNSNLYVFEREGSVNYVDGYDGKVLEKKQLTHYPFTVVENVMVRGVRKILIADTSKEVFLYSSIADSNPVSLGVKNAPVHSAVDIGKSRALIAYSKSRDSVVVELICTRTAEVLDSVLFECFSKVKQLFCPPNYYGKVNVRTRVGADHGIISLDVKNTSLVVKGTDLTDKNVYLDELYSNGRGLQIYAYHYFDENEKGQIVKSSKGVMANSCDEKLGTISYEHETKILGERGSLSLSNNDGSFRRSIDLCDDVLYKHIHFPKHRICGITLSGYLYRICFRQQAVAFIQDA